MKSNRPYLLRALYEWILDCQCTPYITVRADVPGVDVPQAYVSEGLITLNLSPQSIRDLLIANDTLSFDGRFGGNPYRVIVPTGAVIAIYARETGRGMAFDLEEGPPPDETARERDERKAPGLRVVK